MNILTPTADGSNTLFNDLIGEHYHSSHGAVQESRHVFISAGLKHAVNQFPNKEISILEVGFGTGLNFLLSLSYAEENQIKFNYKGIEAFPLSLTTLRDTGYEEFVSEEIWQTFTENYEKSIIKKQNLSTYCDLEIVPIKFEDLEVNQEFDLIYYDAFSVRNQPDMWTNEIIAHACSFLKPKGIFVSYAITGNLKRAIKLCGLTVEKLPGAPGKREMLRATKG